MSSGGQLLRLRHPQECRREPGLRQREWWMAHQGQFPMASQLALGILAIPAMASNCERSFSLAQVNGDVAKGFR
ncbi:Highly reducing polyketide synthase azaB [Fusarium oxysporum f. sp. albedinis]|nr:Highly reducing polyketide synthase azaB [Fusarium oxysporum f. sp. albedinis]